MEAHFADYNVVRLWRSGIYGSEIECAGHKDGIILEMEGQLPILICGEHVDIYIGVLKAQLRLPNYFK